MKTSLKSESWGKILFALKKQIKLCFLFLFLLIQTLQAKTRAYQGDKISLNIDNTSVSGFLDEVERRTDFRFIYKVKDIDLERKVSIHVKNLEISNILTQIFKSTDTDFNILNKRIYLTKNNKPKGEAPKASLKAEKQDLVIKGRILDNKGQPLPGASVVEKGTLNSATTDFDGNFILKLSKQSAALVFSYIGFESQEITYRGQQDLSITLKAEMSELTEVVVVGYGKQKKINVTGAVASITSQDIEKGQFLNIASLMQGKLPGLQVIQNSGAPGAEGNNLQVRGVGTFSGAGVNPLIIIDGVAGGDINSLNPESIESISVLKDAASAAIYGARAANGVVLVTTKTGTKKDSTSFDYHVNTAFYSPTKLPDLIWNSVEYMELWNEAIKNFGRGGTPYTQEQIDLYRNPTNKDQYPNYNWLDKMIDTRSVTNHTLSVAGTRGDTNFFAQVAHLNQPGTYLGYDMDRTSIQFNMDTKLSKILEFGTKIGLIFKERNSPYGDSGGDGVDPFLSTLAKRPTYAPVLIDGSGRYTSSAFGNESGNKNSWFVSHKQLYDIKSQDYRFQAYLRLKPLVGLEVMGTVAMAGVQSESKFMFDKISTYNFITGKYTGDYGNNNFDQSQYKNNLTTTNLYGSYKKSFGDHGINAILGTSYETYKVSSMGATRLNYITSSLTELDAGPTQGQTNSGNSSEWALLSYFSRLGYNFKNKYLFELNARYDGSSRFSQDNRWGFFPSVSAGWNIAEEEFFKADWVKELKLRGSWGSLGNQEISYYPYQLLLNITNGYPFGDTLSGGVQPTALNNENITWETTTITDFGIDAEFFNRKLILTFDYYNKRTSDILRRADIPAEIGFIAPLINNGVMVNKGMELGITTRGSIGKGFSYTVGGTISGYRNELTKYGSVTYGQNYINKEGHPFESYYLWEVQGIFQTKAEVAGAATQASNPGPGDLRYVDQNRDGKINSDDRVFMDGRHPDFEYSFNLGLQYKGFSLNAMLYGVEGRKFYTGQWGYEPFRQGSPPPVQWRDRWTPEKPSNTMPRIYPDGTKAISEPSNFWLEDASYLRLRSLDISYDFFPEAISSIRLTGLTLYLSGQNLFTITDFTGFDPERVGNSVRGGVRYPQNKVYSLGVKVKF